MERPGSTSSSSPSYPVPSKAERIAWQKGIPTRMIADSLMRRTYPQWYKAQIAAQHKASGSSSGGALTRPAETTFAPAPSDTIEEAYTEEGGTSMWTAAGVVGLLALLAGGAWWYYRR